MRSALAGSRGWPKQTLALAIALGVAGVLGALVFLGERSGYPLNASYENKTVDWRFLLRGERGPQPDDPVLIVGIDDQSLEALNVRWPWPRSMYAKVIDRLSQAGAHVVAFDFIFTQASTERLAAEDKLLGDAIIRSRAWIVLGSKFYTKKTPIGTEVSYVAPIPKIDPGKTHVGYVNYWADSDGVIRHAALLRKHQGKLYYSFVLKILSRYYNIQSPVAVLTERQLSYGPLAMRVAHGANLLINYRGGPGNFKTISFENVVDDEVFKGMLERHVFKDKIVLVGPIFTEAQDFHVTPHFHPQGKVSGVEIHANVLNTILEQRYLHPASLGLSIAILFLLALLLAMLTMRLRPWQGLGVMALLMIGYIMFCFLAFMRWGWILPIFNPIFTMIIVQLGLMTYLLLTEEVHSRRIKSMFSRYVSPKVVDQLVHNPQAELRLGGNKQIVTVLFSDIRGFTSLSEQWPPEKVVEQLNQYFQVWAQIIFAYDGMVDKFIGDAVMAIFGAPMAHADDPIRAVRAALDMQTALRDLQARWREEGKPCFQIGVGINTGEAIVGNMGSQQAMGYTVIGDTVNLASRLEGKTKDLGVDILISSATYHAVADQVEVQAFHDVTVKGKAQAFSVYAVTGLKSSPPEM